MGFGNYPATSLKDARIERDKAKKLLAKNIDPKLDRDKTAQSMTESHNNTFLNIASQWFEVKQSTISKDFATDTWRSFELHVLPSLGKVPIHKISAPLAINALKPVAARGSFETVKRLCQRLNEVMVFAVNSGHIKSNPLAGIKAAFQTPDTKHMPTIQPEQLPSLIKTLQQASIKITTRCLIEWQLHTMVRPSEAAGTRWEEIDLKENLWCIPAHRMKKDRAHRVPLTPESIAILEKMKTISGHREFVFPSNIDPKKHINESTANMALKRMGYKGKLVAHGLRSLASTTLNEQTEFNSDLIETALAHKDKDKVRAAYNRTDYLNQRKEVMQWWSSKIATIQTKVR